ncbi:TIGR04222 domain-containing protein [Streptoalloteichus tenebrarius]|uniref:TIGR04222 domain-containing protein n=1 Tax=Streptoalloteichus tenebrarius (strain ATCC 17920 / DSM 40477 / JCM 4838 / CBS 697.72 / NBRC 16177 / NCIMB 11028 / NRRL B-12390 / A12253. 1 / ISP 5477) TaxID=1933 RepID=A0ABT1HS28_STRSD|nr:TIGR04222 domain-containing membrane protein [Streptoalloteichus tenebrarius]MCP2258317.1 TIGR04222 domain-containing protein [Streptoalloteichus tenebrarius]BFF03481.1 TIGR04222 domain-containing membrane protein [Streptoalloteichus tenebrarius]
MDPWGLSEPKFLALYATALPVALLWASAVRSTLRRSGEPARDPSVDLLDLAFLAGGAHRVAEVLVARQLDAGTLRLTARGLLPTAAPVPTGEADRIVSRAVPTRGRPLDRVVADVAGSPLVAEVGARLVRTGHVVDPHAVGRARAWAVFPLLVLAAVGLVRWCTELVAGASVDWDTTALGLTALAVGWVRRRQPPIRTAAGDRLLRAARRVIAGHPPAPGEFGLDPAVLTCAGPAALVALHGLNAHPDHLPDPPEAGAGWPAGWWRRGDSVAGSSSPNVG